MQERCLKILNVNKTFLIVRQHRTSCQHRGAFIAPLPTENNNILGLKCSLHHWIQIPNLFIAPLPLTVCSEQKDADRAECAVGIFVSKYPTAVRDGDITLNGSHIIGDGWIFIKKKISTPHLLMATYRMNLISAGSISPDGTFN
jgi:hypothetical protein